MIVKLNISENARGSPQNVTGLFITTVSWKQPAFIARNAGNLIMQEYVEGPSVGVSMLLDESQIL